MLLVNLEIVEALHVNQQFIVHMTVGTGPVKARAVRNVRHAVPVADLHDALHLFGAPGKNNGSGDLRHNPLVAEAALVAARPAPVPFTHGRIIRYILLTYYRL